MYSCGANLKTVLGNLEHDASKLLYWFKINSMKANPEKFQFMILSIKFYQPQKLSVNTFTINESDEVELIGLTIDKVLNFSKHTDKLCRNAQYKLHPLRRIRKYLSLEKAKMLGNAFIDSQFNYALLTFSPRTTPFSGFTDYFRFSHFLDTSRPNPLDSALSFT